jgi:hypothetical protein
VANAASGYVVPIGSGVASGIWGPGFDSKNYPVSPNGVFDTYGPDGQLDPRGPNASAIDAWNQMRLGYGTVAAPDILNQAATDAMQRYAGDPNNGGAGGWDKRWQQWNMTDVVGPDGRTLFSPVHQTGLRVSQDYGARDDQGNPLDASQGNIFQGFTYAQNKLAQNPYLDPTNGLAGLRGLNSSSPYGMPNPSDYVSGVQSATGGPGAADFYGQRGLGQNQGLAAGTDFDQYGLRGIDQTNDLARANLRQLTRGIDTEAEQTLANRLPEISQAMEAAGLGRSGAGQLQMLNAQKDIMGQANRDKQRVMADYTDREANRQAAAINLATQQGYGGQGQKFGALSQAMNLGSQIGAQGQGQYADLAGRASMQGSGDLFTANQANRQNEQALWAQMMADQNQRYGVDSGNYLNALNMSGANINQRLGMQDAGQSNALHDWLALQGNRDATQANSLNQALTLANAQRQIQQDRLNQMLQAGMQPWDTQLRIATGTTAPSSPQGQNNSFWNSGLGQGIGAAGVNAAANWMMGSNQPSQNYNDFAGWIG